MAMLVIQTQVYENYGAHAWEGEGECPQYWKPKGGSEYKVPGVDLNDDHYWREYIIDWSVEADDYLSQFERDQLKWDGKISHPDKVLQVA
jgi:hypothetical protein